MSDERRRQRQRERQRQRRANLPTVYQPTDMHMPGPFGWLQRRGRVFYLLAIVFLLLSLSGAFIAQATRNNSTNTNPTPTPAASASASATASASASATGTGTPAIQRRYSAPPPLSIDPSHSYEALIRTEKGDIRVQLLPDAAPQTVNNFVFLARNRFFDGLTFHRVLPGFVAQGGDPAGNGTGGPGYTLPAEKNSLPFDAGVIAMASSQQGVSGSQFFITLDPQPALQPNFTVFGRVTEGLDVARALTLRDPTKPAQPPPDRILSVQISEKGP